MSRTSAASLAGRSGKTEFQRATSHPSRRLRADDATGQSFGRRWYGGSAPSITTVRMRRLWVTANANQPRPARTGSSFRGTLTMAVRVRCRSLSTGSKSSGVVARVKTRSELGARELANASRHALPPLHGKGHGFEPPIAHSEKPLLGRVGFAVGLPNESASTRLDSLGSVSGHFGGSVVTRVSKNPTMRSRRAPRRDQASASAVPARGLRPSRWPRTAIGRKRMNADWWWKPPGESSARIAFG